MGMFLDSNAHVPMSKSALNALKGFNKSNASHGNPNSPSFIGKNAAKALESARENIARLIGAQNSNQIIFTSSATQACEWAVHILDKAGKHNVAMSPMEHPAVRMPIKEKLDNLAYLPVFNIDYLPIFKHEPTIIYNEYIRKTVGLDRLRFSSSWTEEKDNKILDELDVLWKNMSNDERIKVNKLSFKNLRNKNMFVCIHVQNEIGTIQPIEQLSKNNFVFSDMVQTPGKLKFNVTDMNVDISVFGAHKFGGPSGVGFMYLKDTSIWQEFGTGSRYFMDICGSANTSGIVATSTALSKAIETIDERTEKMVSFQNCSEKGLKELGFEIIGENQERVKNTTFAKLPAGKNALNLMLSLGENDVHMGLGSACGALHTGSSTVMKALGIESDEQEYIRISQWGDYGKEEAEMFVDILYKVIDTI